MWPCWRAHAACCTLRHLSWQPSPHIVECSPCGDCRTGLRQDGHLACMCWRLFAKPEAVLQMGSPWWQGGRSRRRRGLCMRKGRKGFTVQSTLTIVGKYRPWARAGLALPAAGGAQPGGLPARARPRPGRAGRAQRALARPVWCLRPLSLASGRQGSLCLSTVTWDPSAASALLACWRGCLCLGVLCVGMGRAQISPVKLPAFPRQDVTASSLEM